MPTCLLCEEKTEEIGTEFFKHAIWGIFNKEYIDNRYNYILGRAIEFGIDVDKII